MNKRPARCVARKGPLTKSRKLRLGDLNILEDVSSSEDLNLILPHDVVNWHNSYPDFMALHFYSCQKLIDGILRRE
jgi:hypothetical protein